MFGQSYQKLPCSFPAVGNIAITVRKFVNYVRPSTKRDCVVKFKEAGNFNARLQNNSKLEGGEL